MIELKALPIYVYSNKFGDCTNGGISSEYDTLLLIHEEGFIEINQHDIPKNLVKVVTRQLVDGEYKHIEPYHPATGIGWMAGGNYASTSDARFSKISKYPLAIHDRQESQENMIY